MKQLSPREQEIFRQGLREATTKAREREIQSYNLEQLRGWAREAQAMRWGLENQHHSKISEENYVRAFGKTKADSDAEDREFIASFEAELRRRVAAGLLVQRDADTLLALSMPAPKPPRVAAAPSAGEERALRDLIIETRAVLRELRDAKARLPDDAALAESVIVRAASFASDTAVRSVQQRASGDITLQYDASGKLVSFTSSSGVTRLVYDNQGKLVKFERPRMDA